ncbi:hypothetical protein M405DRAFT_835149 [Rhizopogon salebrosus TDB-379]|nr:hypothetical protein M405DRAFT_835149 [Rhizopogon salebrosus TDB-379]
MSDTARPVSVATPDLDPEEELDELLMSDAAMTTDGDHDAPVVSKGFPWHVDNRAKRTVPDKALSSSKRPAKRARYTASVSPVKSNKYKLPKAQLDLNSLFAPRKALHPCESCAEKKLCLTVTKRGVVQNRCAPCIVSHKRCEWKTYSQVASNWAYRKQPSSFYDPVDTAEPSEESATVSTSAPASTITSANTRFVVQVPSPPVTVIRPRCGPKSAIKRLGRLSGSHTRASPPPPPSGTPPSTSALPSPGGKAELGQRGKHDFTACECNDSEPRDLCMRCLLR